MKQLVVVLSLFVSVAAWAERVPPGTTDEVRARLAPVGELCMAGKGCGHMQAAASGGGGLGLSGEQVYNQFCFACHTAGVGGAPKLHNADDWKPRLDKGVAALLTSMQQGIRAMPPKGTCMGCSDDELKAAMEFMSGAK